MGKKKVRLSELPPIMEETLRAGGTVRLPITGTSMLPLLVEGRDTVALQKALQKYDLPLYLRKDGAIVLHRVVGVNDDGTYTMCGDNQWVKESGNHAGADHRRGYANYAQGQDVPRRRGEI